MMNKMLITTDSPSNIARVDQTIEVDVEAVLIKFDNVFYNTYYTVIFLIIVHAVLCADLNVQLCTALRCIV